MLQPSAMGLIRNLIKWLALLAVVTAYSTTLVVAVNPPDADQKGPVFLKEPTNRIDFSNSTGAEIECKASGNPMPEIIWIRSDGTAVGDVPGLRQISSDGKLVFPPFRAEDYRQEVHAQVYACLARNQFGSIISRDVHVRAVVNQYYEAEVVSEYVIKGNTAVLKCTIPSFVADFVKVEAWLASEGTEYLPTEDFENYDGKYLVLPSGELHIREVGPEDGYKSYQCRTKHRLTGETRLSATKGRLVITEPVGRVSPKFPSQQISSTFVAAAYQSLTLLCLAQAYPAPVFRWVSRNS
ncbi:cell adhesion molecule Dscam1-like [Haematobia irritans]|uniref:cell adhesion molecule Dscam1-like n=1 Tax=Haematobia irritans TaxID=7368 RepID=UPI003F4F5A72